MQATTVSSREGMVVGPGQAVAAGVEMLRSGGNALDAAVAMALAAGVVAPAECGLAGYGGALVAYLAGTGEVACVEFDARAPAAAHAHLYAAEDAPESEFGARVPDRANSAGTLALAVPGTPAGLARALALHGSASFGAAAGPAIRLARDGFGASPAYVAHLEAHREAVERFPETAEWLLPEGRVPQLGEVVANEGHARFLERLAADGIGAFYQGGIAHEIAAHARAHGGILTEEDLASYRPQEGPPLHARFHGYDVHTAPLPAGGASVLQGLKVLEELDLDNLWRESLRYHHAVVLTLQSVWSDRLAHLGDPEAVAVPLGHLLSDEYAAEVRRRIEQQVHDAAVLHGPEVVGLPGGTVHINTADRHGSLVALTLTHGDAFGSFVSLPGNGTLLGGGMDRFDPVPGRANSIGPRKRPLNNMCPTLVLKDGQPVLALGGFGGRKIVSAVFQCLLHFCGLRLPVDDAVAYPRVHTEGSASLLAEARLPQPAQDYLRLLGYGLITGQVAGVHAIQRSDGGLLLGVPDPRAAGLAVGL